MKHVRFFLPAVLALVIVTASCNNSGTNTTPKTDTAANADSIKSDPSKFSDPH